MSSLRHFDLSLPVSRPPTSAALRVSRIRALRGPNYWRLAPVIACDVRLGELEELASIDLPGFCDRLIVAARGRASQMNAGASAARGDTLLFLHADTQLATSRLGADVRSRHRRT